MIEPQEEFCACKRNKKKSCLEVVLFILVTVLALAIGLIVGAMFATTILEAMSAIIVFIAVLVLLIIINLVLLACDKKRC